jgi:hypothetical protein
MAPARGHLLNGERYPGVAPRLGHVQAVGLTAGGDAAAGQQRIDAASGAQVQVRLAGAQVGHCDRVPQPRLARTARSGSSPVSGYPLGPKQPAVNVPGPHSVIVWPAWAAWARPE